MPQLVYPKITSASVRALRAAGWTDAQVKQRGGIIRGNGKNVTFPEGSEGYAMIASDALKVRPSGAELAAQASRHEGLGDTLAAVFSWTGITWLVKKLAGKKCGCSARRKWLNQLLPYR